MGNIGISTESVTGRLPVRTILALTIEADINVGTGVETISAVLGTGLDLNAFISAFGVFIKIGAIRKRVLRHIGIADHTGLILHGNRSLRIGVGVDFT